MTPERRRLHPAAILAEGLDQLRALAVPVVVLVFVGSGGGLGDLLLIGAIGTVVALAAAVTSWARTEWWVDGASIRLRQGVLTERITSVPLERVQAVDSVRGPAQRLLGAVEVHVQTAGGGARGEIVLKAVAPEVAEELRSLARGAAAVAEPSGAAPSWRLGPRRLLAAALTSGSLGVLVPVVAGGSQVLDEVLSPEDAERLLLTTPRDWLLALAAVLAVAWVLSVLGTIVAFSGFTVTRDGDRLRIARGIVERREASVPVARIGAIRIVESPLREPFGLAQVRIESAGYANEPATAQALLPLVRRGEVDAIVRELLPELAGGAAAPLAGPPRRALGAGAVAGPLGRAPGTAPLASPPRRALRRYVLPPVAAAALLALALLPLLGPAALAALALAAPAAAFGAAAFRTAGWRLDGGRVVLRRRGLQRTTLVADARRLPEVFTRTSALQRRAGLTTLGVAVASGRRLAVAHLDAATAADLLGRLTRTATAARA
ncbi:MAG TPA: PH domain-containing protein [Solirubrobacteraceae bacterium]|jgi:putative membrane protein|nr:PH domain-containing protein [Solirubrobacteraceae bacterium]